MPSRSATGRARRRPGRAGPAGQRSRASHPRPTRTMAAAWASQPHRRSSTAEMSSLAKARAACRNVGAARPRAGPVTPRARVRPSRTRSTGRGGLAPARAGPGRRGRPRRDSPGARQAPGEHGCHPGGQVGLPGRVGVERLEPLSRLEQQRRGVAAQAGGEHTCPRSRSTRALANSSSGPVPTSPPSSAVTSSPRAWPNSPASRLTWAAASVRSTRRTGSTVSRTARSRNAAAAARPPRLRAWPAECSSSAAIASSRPGCGLGPVPGPAIRVGQRVGERGQRARCTARRCLRRRRPVGRERSSGCRNRTRVPNSTRPASTGRTPGPGTGCPAARPPARPVPGRRTDPPPPAGAAAVFPEAGHPAAAGSAPGFRPGSDTAPGSPNPPASCPAASPRGSSSSASGLLPPRRVGQGTGRVSSGPGSTEPSSARASVVTQPGHRQAGQPCQLRARHPGFEDQAHRVRTHQARDEAERLGRGPVQPLLVVDHADQRGSARPARRGGSARPGPPGTDPAAARRSCRTRSAAPPAGVPAAAQPVQHQRAKLVQPGEGQLHLGWHTRRAHHLAVFRNPYGQVVEQHGLAHARLAVQHQHPALARRA